MCRIQNLKKRNPTNKLLSDAISETRRVSHELMPGTLEEFGLKSAIDEICNQLQDGVKFICRIQGLKGRLEKYLELAVYRTVQELMINVAKHAGGNPASVKILISPAVVEMTVSDNGRGIAEHREAHKSGIGLASIRSKIKLLNGEVHITSAPAKGTSVKVTIPLMVG